MTCRICGHHQNGACCERCHVVHRKLWQEIADKTDGTTTSFAKHVLAGLDQGVAR